MYEWDASDGVRREPRDGCPVRRELEAEAAQKWGGCVPGFPERLAERCRLVAARSAA